MVIRHLQTLRLYFIKSPMKRASYMKKKDIFHSMGERVMITSRRIPLYAKLISIGDNVIIAAGALANKDIPSNSVWGGVPARFICSFEDYLQKRRRFTVKHPADNTNQLISKECENEMWAVFHNGRLSRGDIRDGKD